MAATEEINRVFREFRRYTGDGLPSAPVGAPLPVGDPQSGVHNPKKAEIRATLIQVLIEAGLSIADAEAAADRAEAAADAAEAAVAGVSVTSFATRALAIASTPAVATDYIRLEGFTAAGDGGGALYKKVVSEPTHTGKFSITVAGSPVWYEIAENVLKPQMFGAVGDWNGTTGQDNFAALTALFQVAKALKREVSLPTGNYYSSLPIAISDMCLNLVGAGFGNSILTFPAVAGVGFALTITQADYTFPTHISGFTLATTSQEGADALKITYGAADSTANRNVPRCVVADIEVRGQSFLNSGWRDGIVLQDCHNAVVLRPFITGRRDAGVSGINSFNKMRYGINVIGSVSAIPADILIDNAHVSHTQQAIRGQGEVEGLLIRTPVLIGVVAGVVTAYSSTRPWVLIHGGHINCFTLGVDLVNAPQSTIKDLLIYKFEQTTTQTIAVRITGCDDTIISNLNLQNQAATEAANGRWDGIQVTNSARVIVDGIEHVRPTRTVQITGTSTSVETRNIRQMGTFSATPVIYEDVSSGNNERRASYIGAVLSTGVAERIPTNWTAGRNSAGVYTITHNLNVSTARQNVSATSRSGSSVTVQRVIVAANSFQVVCTDAAGTLTDAPFGFEITTTG